MSYKMEMILILPAGIRSNTCSSDQSKDARLVRLPRYLFNNTNTDVISPSHLPSILPEFRIYKWLRVNTIDRLSGSFPFTFSSDTSESLSLIEEENVWKERKDAESAMKNYLADLPSKSPPYAH